MRKVGLKYLYSIEGCADRDRSTRLSIEGIRLPCVS